MLERKIHDQIVGALLFKIQRLLDVQLVDRVFDLSKEELDTAPTVECIEHENGELWIKASSK